MTTNQTTNQTTSPESESKEARAKQGFIVEKFSRWIRYCHWLNVPFISIMIWSGLLIYWANPQYLPMPDWLAQALFLDHRLAEGMGWHFAIMWLFSINGIVYVSYLLLSGEWREIVPLKRSFGDALDVVRHDLKLRKELPPQPGKINGAQRFAYTGALALGFVVLITGIAIYKPVQVQWLTESLGGYPAARLEHFLCMVLLVGFIFIHLLQVFRAGWKNLCGMITGIEEPAPRRLRKSLVTGALFFVLAVGIFIFIRFGPQKDHLPVALRDVQKLNEKVGRKLVSNPGHAPFKAAPLKGKAPRVNGLIGLRDDVDSETYRLHVESGTKTLVLKIEDIEALPRTEATTDFKCVEGWTEVFQYAGVRFSDFMKAEGVGLHDDGSPYPYVGMETPDKTYFVSMDIKSMMSPDTVLAFEMNGDELAIENGYPLRLMIPSKYGIKNLKRVGRIFFSDTRPPDYWQKRGYDWFAGL